MRGDPEGIQVLRPRTAQEAVAAFGRSPRALPLAGGTDLMVAWNVGLLNGRTVLDLSAVSEWAGISKTKRGLRLGALLTHARLQRDPIVRSEFPLLVKACAMVGAAQIQNRGTLGGNIANASPAGDTFPPLAVYEAAVRALSPSGERLIPFSEVFAGVKKTILGPSELFVSIELPYLARGPSRQMFRKVGTRAAQAISKTVAAGLLWLGRGGVVEGLRFALGSVAPTVRRLKTVEEFLRDKRLTAAALETAVGLLERDVSPIDDIRSTREYRLEVSRNLLREFLSAPAGAPSP